MRWESDGDVPGCCFSCSINRGTVMDGFTLSSCPSHYRPQTAVMGFGRLTPTSSPPLSRGGSAQGWGRAQSSSGIQSRESKGPSLGRDTPPLRSQALAPWLGNREARTRYSNQWGCSSCGARVGWGAGFFSEPGAHWAFPPINHITLWIPCWGPLCTDEVAEAQGGEAIF